MWGLVFAGHGSPPALGVLGCSRSSAPRLGDGSGELLTAGTPLGRVSRAHGRCPSPHQRPRRRSTMLLAPALWCAAVLSSPKRRTPQGKVSSGVQRSRAACLPPPPVRRDNCSLPAGERSRSPLDRWVAHCSSQGQRDLG